MQTRRSPDVGEKRPARPAWQADAPAIRADPNPGLLRGLLHGFYDCVWLSAAALTSPWWGLRSLRNAEFRGMVAERLALRALPRPIPGRRRVLVHGVSVGEIKGAAPLVRRILAEFPDAEVVVSSTTSTGLAVARQVFPQHAVVRFPFDMAFVTGRFLATLQPVSVVLMELEIWPNFLRECNRRGVSVAVVNGRITPKSFRRYRWFRRSLPQFN